MVEIWQCFLIQGLSIVFFGNDLGSHSTKTFTNSQNLDGPNEMIVAHHFFGSLSLLLFFVSFSVIRMISLTQEDIREQSNSTTSTAWNPSKLQRLLQPPAFQSPCDFRFVLVCPIRFRQTEKERHHDNET